MWLIQSPTTMWQIQKSHYDVANSMSHYDVANSKPTSTWLIQSPLRCDTIYKARYDAALLTKPVATRHPKARCYTTPLKHVATWLSFKAYIQEMENFLNPSQIMPTFCYITIQHISIAAWGIFVEKCSHEELRITLAVIHKQKSDQSLT